MHAYEAENQARMMTMTAARHNIGTRLATLTQREQQLRQEEITSEIIELAAGAEALGAQSVTKNQGPLNQLKFA